MLLLLPGTVSRRADGHPLRVAPPRPSPLVCARVITGFKGKLRRLVHCEIFLTTNGLNEKMNSIRSGKSDSQAIHLTLGPQNLVHRLPLC